MTLEPSWHEGGALRSSLFCLLLLLVYFAFLEPLFGWFRAFRFCSFYGFTSLSGDCFERRARLLRGGLARSVVSWFRFFTPKTNAAYSKRGESKINGSFEDVAGAQ